MTDDGIVRQWDTRWRGLKLGYSDTTTIWGGGCVLCALRNAGVFLGAIEPSTIPPHVNQRFRDAGNVFINDDLIVVPYAAPLLNMEAGDMIESPLASHLDAELDRGGVVLLRVSTHNTQHGDHTVIITGRINGGGYQGACSVAGPFQLRNSLDAVVDWGDEKHPDLRHYRTVSMRGLRRMRQ